MVYGRESSCAQPLPSLTSWRGKALCNSKNRAGKITTFLWRKWRRNPPKSAEIRRKSVPYVRISFPMFLQLLIDIIPPYPYYRSTDYNFQKEGWVIIMWKKSTFCGLKKRTCRNHPPSNNPGPWIHFTLLAGKQSPHIWLDEKNTAWFPHIQCCLVSVVFPIWLIIIWWKQHVYFCQSMNASPKRHLIRHLPSDRYAV